MGTGKTAFFIIFDRCNRGPQILFELLAARGGEVGVKLIYHVEHEERNVAALLAFAEQHEPLFFGLSFASHSAPVAFALGDLLRERFKVPVLAGGIHPTIEPESCLAHCDAVCVGEGEAAITAIVDALVSGGDYRHAPNLAYRRDGVVVRNPLAPLVEDLDALPLRRLFCSDHVVLRDGRALPLDLKRYTETIPDEKHLYIQYFARGCPFSCAYCCNSFFQNLYPGWRRFRSKGVESIIAEIVAAVKLNPAIIRIFIADDCFFEHDEAWLEDFAARFARDVGRELNFLTIPKYITPVKLAILKKCDFSYVSIGLQSGSERTNRAYKRPFSAETFIASCRTVVQAGIGLVVNVILDNPWENDEDYWHTLDVLTQLPKPFYVLPFSLKIYPGTLLWINSVGSGHAVPVRNSDYFNYNAFAPTDVNRLIMLTQFLPRGMVMGLFARRRSWWGPAVIRAIHALAGIIMPFHVLRVAGSRKLMSNVRIALSRRATAMLIIRNMLGLSRESRTK